MTRRAVHCSPTAVLILIRFNALAWSRGFLIPCRTNERIVVSIESRDRSSFPVLCPSCCRSFFVATIFVVSWFFDATVPSFSFFSVAGDGRKGSLFGGPCIKRLAFLYMPTFPDGSVATTWLSDYK